MIENKVPICKNAISFVFKSRSELIDEMITRCPLDEIGKNSVSPCKTPVKISSIYFILAKCQSLQSPHL